MDRTLTVRQKLISGHEPQMRLNTKTDRRTDRQSQCDFDFELLVSSVRESVKRGLEPEAEE
jgi:hypothetical protein